MHCWYDPAGVDMQMLAGWYQLLMYFLTSLRQQGSGNPL
jgi:hypothetical protein